MKSWRDVAERLDLGAPAILCTDHLGSLIRDRCLDEYLAFLGVFLTYRSDDLVVIRPPLSGWLDHVRSLEFGRKVVVDDTGHELLGPDFDWTKLPEWQLVANYPKRHHPRTLVSQAVQEEADSKACLHQAAPEHGVPVLAGGGASCWDELVAVVEGIGFPLYLKRDGGSGGDYVCRVRSRNEMAGAVEHLLGVSGTEDFGDRLVAEQDGYRLDREAINFTVSAVLGPSAELLVGYSRPAMRAVEKGIWEWQGSSNWQPSSAQRSAIDGAFTALAAYWRSLGYLGPVGPNGLLIRSSGSWDVRWFDANARFPVSVYAWLIANSLGYRCWRNLNVDLPFAVGHFEQLRSAGLLADGIVWMASRSVRDRPSPVMKVFLGGETEEDVERLMHTLSARGVALMESRPS